MDFYNFVGEFLGYMLVILAFLACLGVGVGVGLIMWIFIHPIASIIWLIIVLFGIIKSVRNNF